MPDNTKSKTLEPLNQIHSMKLMSRQYLQLPQLHKIKYHEIYHQKYSITMFSAMCEILYMEKSYIYNIQGNYIDTC